MIEQTPATQPTQSGAAVYEFEYERVWLELLNLVAAVDARLSARIHLRDRAGRLIWTLDEWVRVVSKEMGD